MSNLNIDERAAALRANHNHSAIGQAVVASLAATGTLSADGRLAPTWEQTWPQSWEQTWIDADDLS